MGNGLRIDHETFNNLKDVDSKLDAIFDGIMSLHQQCVCRFDKCDGRFQTLERRKLWDTTTSAVFGAVGGAAAIVGKWLIGGK